MMPAQSRVELLSIFGTSRLSQRGKSETPKERRCGYDSCADAGGMVGKASVDLDFVRRLGI